MKQKHKLGTFNRVSSSIIFVQSPNNKIIELVKVCKMFNKQQWIDENDLASSSQHELT